MPISLIGASAFPSGSVLQVQHTQLTVHSTQALTANTDTLVAGFTVNITPTSTSSIIQLVAQVFGEFDHTSMGHNTIFYFMRIPQNWHIQALFKVVSNQV